jgi:hypothetical protein
MIFVCAAQGVVMGAASGAGITAAGLLRCRMILIVGVVFAASWRDAALLPRLMPHRGHPG